MSVLLHDLLRCHSHSLTDLLPLVDPWSTFESTKYLGSNGFYIFCTGFTIVARLQASARLLNTSFANTKYCLDFHRNMAPPCRVTVKAVVTWGLDGTSASIYHILRFLHIPCRYSKYCVLLAPGSRASPLSQPIFLLLKWLLPPLQGSLRQLFMEYSRLYLAFRSCKLR